MDTTNSTCCEDCFLFFYKTQYKEHRKTDYHKDNKEHNKLINQYYKEFIEKEEINNSSNPK
jgi:hypothetical protein